MPKVSLRIIDSTNRDAVLALRVSDNQSHFVANNAKSLRQATEENDKSWPRAIYADDVPVGFVMLYIDEKKPEYFLWRLMIDYRYQKLGYAYEAMQLVIQKVRSLPDAKELETSYVAGEGNPSGFYRKLGFVDTDRMEEGERIMVLRLD